MHGGVKGIMRTPWESAVNAALLLLSTARQQDAAHIHQTVHQCMCICLIHHRSADALRVHEVFSRSGHTVPPHQKQQQEQHYYYYQYHRMRFCPQMLSMENLQSLSLDELALVALQQQPHRAHQSMVVAQMIAAEDNDNEGDDYSLIWGMQKPLERESVMNFPTSSTVISSSLVSLTSNKQRQSQQQEKKGDMRGESSVNIASTETFCVLNPGFTKITEVEQFRIMLQQNMQLLHITHQLKQSLGLHYLLSQMHHIVDNKSLSSQVEISPLVRIGRTVLNHPFIFSTPSTEEARKRLLFEELGSITFNKTLSEVQRTKLMAIESFVDPLKSLCKEPLKFMHLLAVSWDELFIRRVAFSLVLPKEAHNVLPPSRRTKNSSRMKSNSISIDTSINSNNSGANGKREQLVEDDSTLSTWTDSSCELFGSSTNIHNPCERVEMLIRRRIHYNIVVPDTSFLLHNFNQLLQLAKHREIVIPHSVLLDVVYSALDDQGPRRFNSRRVLQSLMYATTSKNTAREWKNAVNPYSIPMKRGQGGVTLLGLQDELTLLEESHERFFLADTFSQQEPNTITVNSTSIGTVLVAKQLEKFVVPQNSRTSRQHLSVVHTSEVDHLVAGVIASMSSNDNCKDNNKMKNSYGVNDNAAAYTSGKLEPLFKSRSRSFWARMPVVLATTNDETRRAAFMVGLSMFPPVSVA
ncbi:hypothetical protein LSM04_005109 [Trypanosoma melophagium]|uniref:uncharacterized protein n=1 Tax=Trypanosoma melophagium TaxID=715481 RepID=UPI003519F57C|nr:hypothetical protein LSM04_005109 [Trypanosoma melophagium]